MKLFGNYSREELKHNLSKEPEFFWLFKYPSSDDEATIERFLRGNPTTSEIFILELALTFGGTNIGIEKEGDEPFMTPELPLAMRQGRVGAMPHDLLVELSEALNGFAKGWGVLPEEEKED